MPLIETVRTLRAEMSRLVTVCLMEPSGRKQIDIAAATHSLLDHRSINDVVPVIRAIAMEAGKAVPTVSRTFDDDRHNLVMRLASASVLVAETNLVDQMANAVSFLRRAISALPADDTTSAQRMIGAEARNHFLLLMDDRKGFRRQVLFAWAATWSIPPTPGPNSKRDETERDEFRSAMTEYYGMIMRSYTQLYGELLKTWGRSLRSPHTIDSMAIVLTALVEGLCLRTFTDDSITVEGAADIFSAAVTDILAAATAPSSDLQAGPSPTD